MSITNKENKVTFKCLDYIKVYKENSSYYYLKSQGKKLEDSQLLRIDFWGLHLLTKGNQSTELMVSDAPFLMTLRKNDDNGIMHACFPTKDTCVHNTLTEDLYKEFRMSLCGYLSLINGAQVQITQEYFNGYSKVYSYKKIENTSCSNYACGDVKFFNPSPILFEFDNYVRWDKNLNLSKFIFHICSAQQLQYLEDRSFILILAFEGLCKKYLEIQKKEHLPQEIVPADDFDRIKKGFHEILKNEYRCGLNLDALVNKVNALNTPNLATFKFRLLLEDTNITMTSEIKNLYKKVRSTLVHEAILKNGEDYMLLSELIQEIVLRLINSKVERHSFFNEKKFVGDVPNLSFLDFTSKYGLSVAQVPIFAENDSRIKLRIKKVR